MKISDLSIGDWVGVRCGTKINAFKVEEIRFNNFIHKYVAILNNKAYGLPTNELHPIPITAEILEKNGFVEKNYDNGKMWDWWCDNVLVRKYADEDIYRFIVVLNSMHYTTTMVVGKHTHQLQHALRLAGIDKELNL